MFFTLVKINHIKNKNKLKNYNYKIVIIKIYLNKLNNCS